MTGPEIVHESAHWALLSKPHGMPTAPLREGEEGTLLSWFLSRSPESVMVRGRKPVEHGLVHRLDTDTCGLVLIAKTQTAMNFFLKTQNEGKITKTYRAFCSGTPAFTAIQGSGNALLDKLPYTISSQFRAFGPGRKQVRPVLAEDRQFSDKGTIYTTRILSMTVQGSPGSERTEITCSLQAGFRHQVRVHLCTLGHPIIGDSLYNKTYGNPPLQLYADGISFIDPDTFAKAVFSLPLPDKMNR